MYAVNIDVFPDDWIFEKIANKGKVSVEIAQPDHALKAVPDECFVGAVVYVIFYPSLTQVAPEDLGSQFQQRAAPELKQPESCQNRRVCRLRQVEQTSNR